MHFCILCIISYRASARTNLSHVDKEILFCATVDDCGADFPRREKMFMLTASCQHARALYATLLRDPARLVLFLARALAGKAEQGIAAFQPEQMILGLES